MSSSAYHSLPGGSSKQFILLDTSGSMAALVGSRRRIDVLADILRQVRASTPDCRLITFDSFVRELEPGQPLPEPCGGTGLHLALEHIAPLRPQQVVVISDGEPDDPQAALAAARKLCVTIATYYCGDDGNHAAIAFLRGLAWCSSDGLGHASVASLRQPERLAAELKLRLAGPAG